MMDPELLAMLVCPQTHQDVAEVDADKIALINQAIETGRVYNRAKQRVTERIDGALIRSDGMVAYPIRDEIPVMLIDEGFDLGPLNLPVKSGVTRNG